MKLMELAEMVKLTTLLKEKTLSSFVFMWKPILDFLLETERNAVLIFVFDDSNCLYCRNPFYY